MTDTPARKDGAPYRPLTIPERDMLFALYEKHNGNMTALSRDPECKFRAYSMIRYWAGLYNFESRLIEIKRKRAEKHLDELTDAKLEALKRARELVEPKLVPLKDKDGHTLLDPDGQPIFVSVPPEPKAVETAWRIIKTELGEPTIVTKSEIENPHAQEVSKALDLIERLSHGGKPPANTDAVPGEREAADSAAAAPGPVQHDLP
jgi:hypothetical protein